VVPSRWEDPFPNVAAEAMMRGTAVIASNWGGVTEIVRERETGLLVPPNDPAALAASLGQVLGDRLVAERMGAAARVLALAELTEDRFLDRIERLYARLTSDGAPRERATVEASGTAAHVAHRP